MFQWLSAQAWHYRLRLKGNLPADPGVGDETTTGELARDVTERYLPNVRLFGQGEVMTNIGILHESGSRYFRESFYGHPCPTSGKLT